MAIFSHITKGKCLNGILKEGIIMAYGQNGKGVYCYRKENEDILIDNLLDFFNQRNSTIDDLIIVDFEFSDKNIFEEPIKDLIYSNEGWVTIFDNIPTKSIIKTRKIFI